MVGSSNQSVPETASDHGGYGSGIAVLLPCVRDHLLSTLVEKSSGPHKTPRPPGLSMRCGMRLALR